MRHASEADLLPLADWLDTLRELPGLTEKKTGIFYRKSKAFLHFHEDAGRLYADVRLDGPDFDRFSVATDSERRQLLKRIETALDR